MRQLACLLLGSLTILAGCRTGQNEEPVVSQAAPSSAGKARILAAKPTNAWTKCADEGGLCTFTGTKAVRFGKGTQWTEPLVFEAGTMGGAPCKPDTSFVGDPAPGVVKECQVSPVTGDDTATRAVQGEWGPLQAWPIIPVHMSLLPSGRLISHNSTNDDLWPQLSVVTQIWNPVTNTLTGIDSRDSTLKSELFCVGFTHLPDGSLLTTGNQPNDKLDYDRNVNRFNFFTQRWSREADTAFYRYYPSMATLGNGDTISFGGTRSAAPFEVMRFDGSWRTLSGMSFFQDINYYPWAQTAPNGQLFYAGPDVALRSIDTTGAGAMAELGPRDSLNRNYGSYAMYDIGKLLVAGGAQPATNSAVVVDINASTPKVTPTGSMASARRHGNLTILADGSVLATGGYGGSAFTDISTNGAVLQAERWNPATGQWSPMAAAQRHRPYHSVAILLPDGRVATGGGGMPFKTGFNQENIEIYSPPYLFQGSTGGSGSYAVKGGLTQGVPCNNVFFGDSAPGVVKSCSYVASTTPPVPATPSTPPANATSCAAENGSCALPPGFFATVYYGAAGKFAWKTGQSGTVACNNGNFGDPVFGTVKTCSYVAGSAAAATTTATSLPANAQVCATENGTCNVPAGVTATVYYGAGAGGSSVGQPSVRPTIGYAPESVGYGSGFLVSTPQAAGITKVHLIKLGAVTHANNQGQRLVPLKFTAGGGSLQVTAPASSNVAPPGPYMLFIVDGKGVPSVARMVQLQQHAVVALVSRQTGKALEVVAGPNGAGTSLRMMGDAAEPSVSMAWDLLPTDGGHFKLVSRANGWVLTVPGSSLQSGAAVQAQPDQSGTHQQWLAAGSSLGYMTLKARHSGYALAVAGASTADGAGLVQQGQGAGLATNAEWVLVPVGYQRLVGLESGKVASITGRSTANGAGVEIAPNGGDAHQSFRFVPRAEGYLSIEAAHSGQVLGVAGASTQPITVLQQQAWTGNTAQQWTLRPQKDGSFMLQLRHSGQFMNVLYHKVDTGAPVGQYPDNGGLPNQYWRLIPAVSLDPHQRNVSGRAIASAHVANVGWMPYVAASNTIGQPDSNNNLEAVKLSVKGLRSGLQISYRAQTPGGAWGPWVGDNQQAGTAGQQQPVQGFQATLAGTRDSCSIRYRGFIKGVGWQAWATEGQTAGVAAAATPLTGLQVNVECTTALLAFKP